MNERFHYVQQHVKLYTRKRTALESRNIRERGEKEEEENERISTVFNRIHRDICCMHVHRSYAMSK